jgi:prepilin-type N-terminal cleavage/methylation domain-containing protein
MKNGNKFKRGFTLVEIIVVLVILAILAAFTIPTYLGMIQSANEKEDIITLGFLNRVTVYYGASISIKNNDVFDGLSTDQDRMQLLVDHQYIDEILEPKVSGAQFYWDIPTQKWVYNSIETGKHYIFKELNPMDYIHTHTWNMDDGFYSTYGKLFIENQEEEYLISTKAKLDDDGKKNGTGYGVFFETSLTNGNKNRDSGYVLQFDRGLGGIVIRPRTNGRESSPIYSAYHADNTIIPSDKTNEWWTQEHNVDIQVNNAENQTDKKTVNVRIDGETVIQDAIIDSSSGDIRYTGFRSWGSGTTYEEMTIN